MVIHWLSSLRIGRLGFSTLRLSLFLELRAVLQAIMFIMMARMLSLEGYGIYVSILAIVAVFNPLVGCGSGILLVREVSRSPHLFAEQFARSLLAVGFTFLPLFCLAILLAVLVLPPEVPKLSLFLFAASELFAVPIVDLSARCYQAQDHMGWVGCIQSLLTALRIIALVIVSLFCQNIDIDIWAIAYLIASLFAAGISLCMVINRFFPPLWNLHGYIHSFGKGAHFAIGSTASKVHADLDKAMLARMDSLESSGVYSAGYRITDIVMLPALAFISSTFSQLCRKGEEGVSAAMKLMFKFSPLLLSFTTAFGLVLFFGAEVVPLILGESFSESSNALRWLSILPTLSILRIFLSNTAVASDLQKISSQAIIAGATSNVLLNLWWIPLWGWKGSVVATYISELIMITILLYTLIYKKRKLSLEGKINV